MFPPASFYFDLSSPEAYLAAERVLHVLPHPAEWQPVLARQLAATGIRAGEDMDDGRGYGDGADWGGDGPRAAAAAQDDPARRRAVAARARQLQLQPLRWPEPFPFDSALAMRVATYAKSIGRTVPFAQAAFRQAFAAGRSLAEQDNVLIAAAACEMHPTAVLRGAELRSVHTQLFDATARAARAGIKEVPAILVGERPFHGEAALERARDYMRSAS